MSEAWLDSLRQLLDALLETGTDDIDAATREALLGSAETAAEIGWPEVAEACRTLTEAEAEQRSSAWLEIAAWLQATQSCRITATLRQDVTQSRSQAWRC